MYAVVAIEKKIRFSIPIPEFSIPIPFSIPQISIPIPIPELELQLSCNSNSGIELTPTLPFAHTIHHTYHHVTIMSKQQNKQKL